MQLRPLPQDFSLGKSSLVTPISTFDASPANIIKDLFCAFQPKRVMVPSLPLLLRVPLIPSVTDAEAESSLVRLLCKMSSGVFSTKPRPNVGVGMRKPRDFCPTPAKFN